MPNKDGKKMFDKAKKVMALEWEHMKRAQAMCEEFEESVTMIQELLNKACENFRITQNYINHCFARDMEKLKKKRD